jgi:cell fate regulator YaaT (PSP1 superfamily)
MSQPAEKENETIIGVRFHQGGKVYHFDPAGHDDLVIGDFVVVDTARGRQIGEVVYLTDRDKESANDLKPILWRATGRDLALRQQWQIKAQEELEEARRHVSEMGLKIKLATAEYTLDGKQITLLYVTGTKEEANKLQRRLRRSIRARIELRQIGPRDHARLLNGYGACGEPRCCSSFLTDFIPISIRMGKAQGVSLTPSEITGMCGRLRCCLSYEHEMYVQASKDMPRRKAHVQTPFGRGKVINLLPLKDVVVVQVQDRRIEVPLEDIEVILNK